MISFNYAFKKAYPTWLEIIDLGYSDEEAQNILRAIDENPREPHYWWMSLARNAPKVEA